MKRSRKEWAEVMADAGLLSATFVCPVCCIPVSVEGRARDGELLHECPKHGWVTPTPRGEAS